MAQRECSEVGCKKVPRKGHSRCDDCLGYAKQVRAHERAESEPLDLTETKPGQWTDGTYTYGGVRGNGGEDLSLDDNDSFLDGAE